MSSGGPVLLAGQEDTENLGLRILAACLMREGVEVHLVPFAEDPAPVVAAAVELRPVLVGVSLIFQNFAPQLARLVVALREAGVEAHVTVGGHYPSFAPEALLALAPGVDSVVRFEGEQTLLELVSALETGGPWRELPGLAWPNGAEVVHNPLRPGVADLDSLPWPWRGDEPVRAGALPTASILGSRGCPMRCAFCSIAPFYKHNGTPGRRTRSPADVAEEVGWLHERGAQVVLFQDDDFLGGGRKGLRWAHAVAAELRRRGLHERVRWRISCRSDEVSEEALRPLVEGGLAHVYLGVESGDPEHLAQLCKDLGVEEHHRAKAVLLDLGLSFDFGFMLLTPWSTFPSVRSNLDFLREFSGDGAVSVGFCRTLPYAGTEVEQRLREEGRLLPGVEADYTLEDPRLDRLWAWLYAAFAHRNNHPRGARNLLGMALYEAHVRAPGHPWDPDHRDAVRRVVAAANHLLCDVVEAALDHAEGHAEPLPPADAHLARLAALHGRQESTLLQHLGALVGLRAASRK